MTSSMRSILVVDGNQHERDRLEAVLRKRIGCVVLGADTPEQALQVLGGQDVCIVISDLFLPEKTGLEFLQKVHRLNPETLTIAAVPEGNRGIVVEVLRYGVFSYINSPYDLEEAVIVAARGLAFQESQSQKVPRRARFRKSDGFNGIIGQSPKMLSLFNMVEKVAEDGESTVLVQGESGTGKELVARALHSLSPRMGKNFVPVNCAAIPEDLLESELFGYVKGAFTGANQSKMGRIQYADGGTLFLDEIGDMKPSLQAKLLRVLQEKEFEPVGGVKPVSVNVRVVAATHRNLEKAVAENVFREDLYYRLSVVPLNIPPLRDRCEDIPLLIEKFMRSFNRNKKIGLKGFEKEAIAALTSYPWPGNVRELENLIQRLVILHGGESAGLAELPEKYVAHLDIALPVAPVESEPQDPPALYPDPGVSWSEEGIDFNALVSDFEDRLILQALNITDGNKKEAARLLNLKRTTLLEKIKKKQLTGISAD